MAYTKTNWINGQTPINATNLNHIEDGIEAALEKTSVKTTATQSDSDTYSCDYINGLNTYSTTEQVVGKWIDGKPIYRKFIQTTNVTFDNYTMLALDNNTNLISYEAYIRRNNNRLDKYASGITNENAMLVSDIRSTGIEIWTDSAYQKDFIELYVIIEYTKTTD